MLRREVGDVIERVILLWVLSVGCVSTAEAYRGDRLVVTGKELVIDGRAIPGTRADRLRYMRAALEQCPATRDMARARETRFTVGQGISLGGLGGMLVVQLLNPVALGAVIGFAAVSFVGDVVMLEALAAYPRLLRNYESECLG